ncbi:hypothetical protein N1851_008369 [Merluccius polli]|uniref:HAT C-terminal dimerisation domain-containing protein n=1 Tax=Merluccius polli TaxID=89951 RepID=A0AA47P4I3_MERPO|nr:hypothetical protein N1851_008369 [Merluccius polli]
MKRESPRAPGMCGILRRFQDTRQHVTSCLFNDHPPIHHKARLVSRDEDDWDNNAKNNGGGPPPTKKDKKSLASFFKISTASATVPNSIPLLLIEAELSAYMQSSTIDNEEDPPSVVENSQSQLSPLSNMARKYLCIQATALPQRLFSAFRQHCGVCERSCLKPDLVNKLVFLAKNL